MATKRITDLTKVTSVADTDLLVVETSSGTRSVAKSTLAPTPVNNVTSTSTTAPLAANQGTVLKSLIDSQNTNLQGQIDTLSTRTSAVESGKIDKPNYGNLVVFGSDYAAGVGNDGYSFVNALEESGCFTSVINHAVAGSTIGNYSNTSDADGYELVTMVDTYATDITNADIVMLEYQYYDCLAIRNNYVSAGNIIDDSTADTVAGYTMNALNKIRTLNPGTHIIWLPITHNNYYSIKEYARQVLGNTWEASYKMADSYMLFDATVAQIVNESYALTLSVSNLVGATNYVLQDLYPDTTLHQRVAQAILNNMYSSSSYFRPRRTIWATFDSNGDAIVYGNFETTLKLLQADVEVILKYSPSGLYGNNVYMRPSCFGTNYIIFDAPVMSDDTTSTTICSALWSSDGSFTSKTYAV